MKNIYFFTSLLFLTSNINLTAQEDWTAVSPGLERRIEATSIAYQGKVYVFHGYLPGWKISHTSEVYDPETDTWSWLAPLVTGRGTGMTHNGYIVADDDAWLVGGKSWGGNILTNVVRIYNFTRDEWRRGPSLPENIGTGSLFKLGRKLHFFGGGTHPEGTSPSISNFCVPNPNTYTLNLDSLNAGWQKNQFTTLPQGFIRIHPATVMYKGKVYVIGGQLGHDCGVVDKAWLHCYDPYTDTWTRLQDMPQPNAHSEPSTFVVDGKIIVAGGERDYAPHGKIFQYDIASDRWSQIDHLKGSSGDSVNRMAVCAKVIGDKMIVSHGGGGSPIQLAYIKDFPRNQQLELGFNPTNMEVALDYGNNQLVKAAWLWTTEGKTTFKINAENLPDWLSISTDSIDEVDETAVEVKCHINSEGLAPGNYGYRLDASAPGYEDGALIINFEVKPSPTVAPPSSPFALNTRFVSRQTLLIQWNKPPQAVDFYEIYRADLGAGFFTKVAQTTETGFVNRNLTPNSRYSYMIKAVNAGGVSEFSEVLHIQTKPFPPSTPVGLQVALTSPTVSQLSWQLFGNDDSGILSFEIYRKINHPAFPRFTFLTETSNLNYTDRYLKPNTEYAYMVRAKNAGGVSVFTNPIYLKTASGKSLNAKNTQLRVYPNPGKDFFFIQLDDIEATDSKTVIIQDILGNEISKTQILTSPSIKEYKILTGQIPQGLYLVKLIDQHQTKTTYLLID